MAIFQFNSAANRHSCWTRRTIDVNSAGPSRSFGLFLKHVLCLVFMPRWVLVVSWS